MKIVHFATKITSTTKTYRIGDGGALLHEQRGGGVRAQVDPDEEHQVVGRALRPLEEVHWQDGRATN